MSAVPPVHLRGNRRRGKMIKRLRMSLDRSYRGPSHRMEDEYPGILHSLDDVFRTDDKPQVRLPTPLRASSDKNRALINNRHWMHPAGPFSPLHRSPLSEDPVLQPAFYTSIKVPSKGPYYCVYGWSAGCMSSIFILSLIDTIHIIPDHGQDPPLFASPPRWFSRQSYPLASRVH